MTQRGIVLALAAQAQAEVIALFTEDEALLRFAALPMAQEIGLAALEWRRLEPDALRRSLRTHQREAEHALAAAARRTAQAGQPALRILLLGEDESGASRWARQVHERVSAAEPSLALEIIVVEDEAALAAALRAAGPCVVLLG